MTFSIIASTDWHPDAVTMGVPRFEEVEQAVEVTVDDAIKRHVDLYLFLGDLADPESQGLTSRAQALSIRTARRLQQHEIPSIWIPGNHDVHEDGSGKTTLTPLSAFDDDDSLIHVAEEVRIIEVAENLVVLCLPFVPISHGIDLDARVRELWPKGTRVITISHLSVPGVMPGSETTDMPRGREIGYPFDATKRSILRLQGHYHRRQDFDPKDGGPPIIIPGSLARLTFGEEDHEPSYLYVEV